MAMDLSQLGVFSQVRMVDNSQGTDVLRLGADGSIRSGGTLNEHNVFRRVGRDTTGNNEVRSQLLKALGDTYGIQGAEVRKDGNISFSEEFVAQLKEKLGDTLKLNDFGIDEKTRLVTSGKPLTERRIVAIVNKVYNHAVAAARDRQDMIATAQVKAQVKGMWGAARPIAEHEMESGVVTAGKLSDQQFTKYVADFKNTYSGVMFCLKAEELYGKGEALAISAQYGKLADSLQDAVKSGVVSDRQALRLMYMLSDGLEKWGAGDPPQAAKFFLEMCVLATRTLQLNQSHIASVDLVRQELSSIEDTIVKYASRAGEKDGFVDLSVEREVANDIAAFEQSVDDRIGYEMRAAAPEPAPKAVGAKSVMRLEANPKALLDVFADKLEKMGLKLGMGYAMSMTDGGIRLKLGDDADIKALTKKAPPKLAPLIAKMTKGLVLDFNLAVKDGKIRIGLKNKELPFGVGAVQGFVTGMVGEMKDAALNARPDLVNLEENEQELVKGFFRDSMQDVEFVAVSLDPKEIFAELRESSGADLAITGFGVGEKGVACELGLRTGEPVKEIKPKGATGGNLVSAHVSYDGLNDTMKGVFEKAGVVFRPNGGVRLESRNGDLMRLTITGLDVRNMVGGKVGFGMVNNIAQTVIGSSADRISIDVTPRFNPVTHQMEFHFMDADSSGPTGRFLAGLLKTGFATNRIVHAKGLPKGVGIALPQTADLSKVPGSRFAVTIDVDNLLGKGEKANLFKGDLSRLNIKPGRAGLDMTFGERRVKTVSAQNESRQSTSNSGFLKDFVDVSQS